MAYYEEEDLNRFPEIGKHQFLQPVSGLFYRTTVACSCGCSARRIAVPGITPLVALVGLLFAALLGALLPSRPATARRSWRLSYRLGGTARHALFLGLTVTITHTLGVLALGMVTL